MTEATRQGEALTRRSFLKLGLGALSGLAVLEMGGASLLFMQPRSLDGAFGGVVAAGAVDSFPVGTVTEFPDGRFFLVRAADGGFLAVYSRCTHLGCSVSWEAEAQHFFCPCHASS
ncbi:MAG: Rieske (2Fe-2S) protein, partial [Anaerolineales bacterium]|nr:Rieske (2Fe-2S) protein [Anaerolineales bacterium]